MMRLISAEMLIPHNPPLAAKIIVFGTAFGAWRNQWIETCKRNVIKGCALLGANQR